MITESPVVHRSLDGKTREKEMQWTWSAAI